MHITEKINGLLELSSISVHCNSRTAVTEAWGQFGNPEELDMSRWKTSPEDWCRDNKRLSVCASDLESVTNSDNA
jgi:hypothetical protein